MKKQIEHVIVSIPDYDGPGIYKIVNLVNGKVYIGSSKNVKQRLEYHDTSFRCKGTYCNSKFFEDIQKGHKFRAEVVEKLPGVYFYELRDREAYYVKFYDSWKNGYNSGPVAVYDPYMYKNNKAVLNWLLRKM